HPELDLVPDQVVRLPLRLHLGPGHAAAVPVRPVDAARMEGAHSAGDPELDRDRNREGVADVMAQSIAFYTLAAFILGFAVLVVSTKDTVHSVLFLVLDFLFVAALYVVLGLAVAGLVELAMIAAYSYTGPSAPPFTAPLAALPVTGNTEEVGWLLY